MLGLLDGEVNETSRVVVVKVIYSLEHHIVLTLAAGSTRQPCLSLKLTYYGPIVASRGYGERKECSHHVIAKLNDWIVKWGSCRCRN